MKRTAILSVTLMIISMIWTVSNAYGQVYDDVYYNPGQSSGSQVTTETYSSPSNTSDQYNNYGDDDYRVYSDGYSSEKYYDEDGDSYVVNNYYYDDTYSDLSYSNYINRFYTPYYGFGYYAPCYNPWGWNSGFGWGLGWNSWSGWNAGFGWGFGGGWGYPGYGWGGGWGYPGYGWGGWGYPGFGWGGGWGPYNPWGNPYWNGYANGYWNGYNNGFYDGYYGAGGGNGYYYGPRSASASNTSGGREYDPGNYSTDRGNGSSDVASADGRDKMTNGLDKNSNYTIAENGIASNTPRNGSQDSKFSVADRDPDATGKIKVVKRFSSEESVRGSGSAKGNSNIITRPSSDSRYTPNNSSINKGNTAPSDRNQQNYQWNDRNVKEQPARNNRPTYTKPDNNNRNNNYNRSQPAPRKDSYRSTPSRSNSSSPSYRSNSPSRSNSSSYNRSSGSSRSSGYSSGSRSSSPSRSSSTPKRNR